MKQNKKKIILIVVGIITFGIVIGVSYAWWTYTATQEGINTIQSSCLKINLIDENPITIENGYPITDEEANDLIPYTFTIQNTCNTLINYDVNLEIMESKDVNGKDNRLSSEYVAVEFNGSKKKLLNTYKEVETSYNKNDYTPKEARYITSGELSPNANKTYTIKLWINEHVTVEDDAMNKNFISKIVVNASQSHKMLLVDYVINDNEIEEFYHEATEQTKALTDYRYVGNNPNNYVCFGSEEETCPTDNLYRIIGVMPTQESVGGTYENRVKLIKADFYQENESGLISTANCESPRNAYPIYKGNSNDDWNVSPVKNEVLNKVYWNSLGEYQKYIASSVWYLGSVQNLGTASHYHADLCYDNERGNLKGYNNGEINTTANIGLMYPSDYAYSMGNAYRLENTFNEFFSNSWLYNSNTYKEWFISTAYNTGAARYMYIYPNGRIYAQVLGCTNEIRPTFYLKSNVLYKSGTGTKENPMRISINE